MKTLAQLRTENPALAAAKTCRLVGDHVVAGTTRAIPRVLVNRGRDENDVARELGLRIGERAERRTETYQDAATVAIDDGEGGVTLAVPAQG